jgi:hypothetical protein
VSLIPSTSVTQESQHRPHLITRRIEESDGSLWGVVTQSNDKEHRIGITDMLSMILDGVPFLVDQKGVDKPAILQVIHRMSGSRGVFYFKTIGDNTRKNNFSLVPSIKYGSSKRIRVLKK